jgi:autotransporter-associated beta strand protein
MNRDSTVGVRASSILELEGVISGAANFTKIGPGTLRFGGGDYNTYTGQTFINEGGFLMGKPFTVTAVPGTLNIGTPAGLSAMAANLTGYQVVGDIVVNRAGLLNVNGQEENVGTLWLYEGGDVQTTSGFLYLKTGGSIRVFPQASSDPSTISGNLGMDPGMHDIVVAQGSNLAGSPELIIDAVISQPLSTAGLQKTGAGTLRLTANNTYSGSTMAATGILQVDGLQPSSSVTVLSGAQLMGIGRVGPVSFFSFGAAAGVVSPGHSPGILSCSSFNGSEVGGILRIELNGATPGANGHDQLYAQGPLNTVTLDHVTLDASLNFASSSS